MRLTQIVEALLFASDAPLTAADIARIDERLDEDTVEAVIQELRGEYEETERAFQIYEVAGGYQLLTRPDFAMHLERFETVPQTMRLSTASLEALAIIAYRQPIGRAEVEEIRGVGSSGALKTLVDRHLIEVVGRGEGLGRPLLYGTTRKFLEHFGLRSLEDMPRPDELPVVLRTRAEPAVIATAEPGATAETAETPPASAESPAAAEEESSGEAAASPAETVVDEATAVATDEIDATAEDIIEEHIETGDVAAEQTAEEAEEESEAATEELADAIASAEDPEASERD